MDFLIFFPQRREQASAEPGRLRLSSRAGDAPRVGGGREGQSAAKDPPHHLSYEDGDSSSRSTAHALSSTPAVPPIRNDSAKDARPPMHLKPKRQARGKDHRVDGNL